MAEPVRPRPEEPRDVTGIERREQMAREAVGAERREIGVMRREPEAGVAPAAFEIPDLVRWGPILAGLVTAFSTWMLLNLLGLAIGIGGVQPGAPPTPAEAITPSALWTALSLLIGLFVGGYIASRTAGITGGFVSAVNGAMVWASWLTLLLILTALTAAGVIAAPGAPAAPGFTITPGLISALAGAAWGSFIALLLGLVAAILGGIVGRHPAPEPEEFYAGMHRH